LGFGEVIGIAIGLGVDCLIASACIGCSNPRRSTIIVTCLSFGLFQFGMASAGMLGGRELETLLSGPVRLLGPLLLAAIGVVMITKGLRGTEPSLKLVGIAAIVGASTAVSIDALGAGVALGLVNIVSLKASVAIGAVSIAMSATGFAGGKMLARRAALAEDLGGGFLIALAVAMALSLR
jgi:putative Mn2+ efflux pump MntP